MNPRLRTAIQAAKQANMPKIIFQEQSVSQKYLAIKIMKI